MSLFSVLGSTGFANFGLGMGAIGAAAGAYMSHASAKHARKERRRERRFQAAEMARAREYDTPLEQAKRLRIAGFNPSRISPGSYGPVVANSSGDVSPVGNPALDALERFGNLYNTFRQIKQMDFENSMRSAGYDEKRIHDQRQYELQLRQQDLSERKFIHETARSNKHEDFLLRRHEDEMAHKKDQLSETANYHEAVIKHMKESSKFNFKDFVKTIFRVM